MINWEAGETEQRAAAESIYFTWNMQKKPEARS